MHAARHSQVVWAFLAVVLCSALAVAPVLLQIA
jgi:hypothetical protein